MRNDQVASSARAKAYEAIELAAKHAAEYAIQLRAHQFALEPSLLENLAIGLSKQSPKKMKASIIAFIDEEMMTPHHNFGFGGEIPLINLHGALAYATQCCAIESKASARDD